MENSNPLLDLIQKKKDETNEYDKIGYQLWLGWECGQAVPILVHCFRAKCSLIQLQTDLCSEQM